MAKKKKVDIRKKRKKLLQQEQKKQGKQEIVKQEKKTEKQKELDIRLGKETKLYWMRAITGALSALLGRLFLNFVGWLLFFWMLGFWFGFPFISSFVIFRFKYDKEEWSWKNILKPGIGVFFFLSTPADSKRPGQRNLGRETMATP